jgi:hypothetical protein
MDVVSVSTAHVETETTSIGSASIWPLGWRLYWHCVAGTWNAFGLSRELFIYSIRRPLNPPIMRALMALDNLFFPSFRRTPVREPVFLLGHPRSGTTFVHRLLTQTREFTVFEFWEILCPSLTARLFVRPLVRRIVQRGGGTLMPKETGHLGALDQVEEEELLYFHNWNTQFTSCLSPLAFSDWDFAELVHADRQAPRIRHSAMRLLRGCLQRQIYSTGLPRAVTKMNYSAMRIASLAEEFPDAKFVYIVRSPLETIPSHLTLHRNMFDYMWGLERIPQPLLQRYYDRRYAHNVAFYRYLEDVIEREIVPSGQLLVISYRDLLERLSEVMQRIINFSNLSVSNELQQKIDEQSAGQANYKRPHKNLALEEYGLTRERILSDLDFVFEKYGFPTQ